MAASHSQINILITGANRGLGKELTRLYLLKPNHTVIGCVRDIQHPSTKSLLDFPTGTDSHLVLSKLESTQETDAAAAIEDIRTNEKIEYLDVVIANAGISNIWPSNKDLNVNDLRNHVEVNVFGVVWLYQATRSLLEESKEPKFTVVGSSAGWIENQPLITNAAYGPSKAAVHWLTKRIDAEEERIASFVLNPGWVQTDLGNTGARYFGLESAETSVEGSCKGMVEVMEKSNKKEYGGKLWDYTGDLSYFRWFVFIEESIEVVAGVARALDEYGTSFRRPELIHYWGPRP